MFVQKTKYKGKLLSTAILMLLVLNTIFIYTSIEDLTAQNISTDFPTANDKPLEDVVLTDCSILSTFSATIQAKPRELKLARIGNQDILFLSCGYDGLILFDFSDVKKPKFIAEFSGDFFDSEFTVFVFSTIIKDSYCLIALRRGIVIYDFSDILNPEKVSEIYIENLYYISFKIRYSALFVIDNLKGCRIYNIENIEKPIFVNRITFRVSNYYDVIFYKDNNIDKIILSVTDYLLEYNYSSILDPKAKMVYYEKNLAERNLKIIDNYLFSTSEMQLSIFDLSLEFKLISKHIDVPFGFTCLAVKDDYLFLASNNHLVKADISSPEEIILICEVKIPSFSIDMIFKGEYLIVLDSFTGIRIYSTNDPNELEFIDTILFSSLSKEVIVSGNYAIYSTFLCGIFIVNIKNPTRPKFVSFIECPFEEVSIFVEEDKLYVFAFSYFYEIRYKILIYDISKPNNPQLIGTCNNRFQYKNKDYFIDFSTIEIIEDKLYTKYFIYNGLFYERGIALINLANPNNLTIQNTFLIGNRAEQIKVNNDYLYIVNRLSRELSIYSLDQSGNIINDSSIIAFDHYIRYIVVKNNYIYTSIRGKGLVIYDIHDLLNPIELAIINHELEESYYYYRKICVSNNYIYIYNSYTNSIYALDINDKSNPILEGTISGIVGIQDLFIANNHIFITSSEISLIIAHLDSIPLMINLSNLIFPIVGFVALAAIGLVYLAFSRKRHLKRQPVEESPKVRGDEEEYPLSIRGEGELVIKDKEIEIPDTDNLELQKYFDQIFIDDE